MAAARMVGPRTSRGPMLVSCPRTVQDLDEFLVSPSSLLVREIRNIPSPLVVLGAGGKMGPSLCVLAARAAALAGHQLSVIAVSRFSESGQRKWLEANGVKTISADLFDRRAVARLPDAPSVIHLVGLKFGTSSNPAATWAANTVIPGNVVEHYSTSRIVVLSTGNVYPMVPVAGGGAKESAPLTPVGEYPNAAVARERLFEWHSSQHPGSRVTFLRLNYAVDLRYGVPHDIARKVWEGEEVDLSNGHFNCIWQGDANDMILRSIPLASAPPAVFNLTGTEIISVRDAATELGAMMGARPRFAGSESQTALLSDSSQLVRLLGKPSMPISKMFAWTASWVMRGGTSLNKPTHFEVRNGQF